MRSKLIKEVGLNEKALNVKKIRWKKSSMIRFDKEPRVTATQEQAYILKEATIKQIFTRAAKKNTVDK